MKTNDDGTIVFTDKAEFDAEVRKANEGIMTDLKSERSKRQEIETSVADLRKQLSEIQGERDAAAAKAKKAELEGAGKYEEALKLSEEAHKKQIEEMNARIADMNARLNGELIDKAILAIASDAIDPQDVMTLVKARYKFEVTDKGVEVKNADGTPLLMDNGGPATVDFAYQKFVADKPHLLKPEGAGGSGSGPNRHEPAKKGTLQEQYRAAVAAGDNILATKIKSQMMGLGKSLGEPIIDVGTQSGGTLPLPGEQAPASEPRGGVGTQNIGRPVLTK